MDDFVIENGKAYCTMQLVEVNAHTGIPGMAHSGSVAQYKKYYIEKSKTPNNLFYND